MDDLSGTCEKTLTKSPFDVRLQPEFDKEGTEVKSWAYFVEVGMGCSLLATSLVTQKEVFVPASDVSFKISTDQTSYKAGQSILLKYRAKNISNAALFVRREWEATCPGAPHVWAWFEDGSGKHFVPGYGGDCSPRPQTIHER